MKMILTALLLASAMPMTAQAQERPSFTEITAQTEQVGQAYAHAYIAMDWDRIESLLHDEASFEDSTANLIFGGGRYDGKAAMMTLFREGYTGISSLKLTPLRSFASGEVYVEEGQLDWGVDMGGGRIVESSMPILTILTMKDGKVWKHRDYADYRPFLAADAASREAAGATP